jgi:starch-binding outer membrane protein, SusD/RagB family
MQKLLLYEKRYSEAKTVFTDVISNGKTTKGEKYALLNHFEYNFNRIYNNNPESVFAQQPESRFERANPGYILAGPYDHNFGSGCCGFF